MCGRYVIARAAGDLLAEVGAEPGEPFRGEDLRELRANWNVAPTAQVPVVLERPDGTTPVRELHVARWGLVPSWAEGLSIGAKTFNARSETVTEKPSFRSAVRRRRCAVPANGYYEWRRRPDPDGDPSADAVRRAAKQPYYVHPADPATTIWFAGLYEWWQDPQGAWVLSCSILTAASPDPGDDDETLAELGRLHGRIPVALDRDGLDAWLDPGVEDRAGAQGLVEQAVARCPAVARGWVLTPVGQEVGNVRSGGPGLVEPVPALF